VTLRRRSAHFEPRRLVVLCDISASMAGHARAMLQLLHSAAVGAEAEVFTFATRLTRITPVLVTDPEAAFRLAGRAAPDWSSGTRIGAAVRQFVDGVETRNLARGAVVVIVSDGWDSGDPAVLDTALERLAQLTPTAVRWRAPTPSPPCPICSRRSPPRTETVGTSARLDDSNLHRECSSRVGDSDGVDLLFGQPLAQHQRDDAPQDVYVPFATVCVQVGLVADVLRDQDLCQVPAFNEVDDVVDPHGVIGHVDRRQ